MKKVIAIVGPTAVGKTALSLDVAKAVGGEIISADSRQVYRGLDIGSGKIKPSEMLDVPHHLLDVADPREIFTVADYVRIANEALENIHRRGKVSVIVGGAGFYVDTLLGRMTIAEVPPDPELREQLEGVDIEFLQETLKKLDPRRYASIDLKNPHRLIRAIEIARSVDRIESTTMINHSSYEILWIGLTLPKEKLRGRIHERLLARLDAGMLYEAKRLHAGGLSYERMEELGLEYRFMARHLQEKLSYEEMAVELEKEISRYAKRQMTWFKRNKEIIWFNPLEKSKILKLIKNFL